MLYGGDGGWGSVFAKLLRFFWVVIGWEGGCILKRGACVSDGVGVGVGQGCKKSSYVALVASSRDVKNGG